MSDLVKKIEETVEDLKKAEDKMEEQLAEMQGQIKLVNEQFERLISDKAKQFKKQGDEWQKLDGHFMSFDKTAQWPLKFWYMDKFAEFVEQLIDDGVVTGYLTVSGMLLAGGEVHVANNLVWDMGPDRYGILFFFFKTHLSAEELNAKYNSKNFSGHEGMITSQSPSWTDISPCPTLASMIKDLVKPE